MLSYWERCLTRTVKNDEHNAPWEKVYLDFKGPLSRGKYLLVIVDRYSRYPGVEVITSINANTVIKKLNKIFAAHGLPEVLTTDNGPPFHSREFKAYMKEIGTNHKFATPYLAPRKHRGRVIQENHGESTSYGQHHK